MENIQKRINAIKTNITRFKGECESVKVDIGISPTKTDTIYIHKGDNITEIAEKFAKEHGLNEETKGKLHTMLCSRLKEVIHHSS